jgi:hypothetical protein
MNAAGSAHLALVPPGDDAPPPAFDTLVRSSAAKRVFSARARRVVSVMWGTGCAALVAGAFLAPIAGEAAWAGMAFACLLTLPASGVALWCFALLDRSRASVTALVAAAAMLVAAGGLMRPVGRASLEMRLSASVAELAGVAEEIRAAASATPFDPDPDHGTYAELARRFGPRLQRFSLRSGVPIDGGLLFGSTRGKNYTLFYADGVAGPRDTCRNRHLRFIGGRWFVTECHDRSAD